MILRRQNPFAMNKTLLLYALLATASLAGLARRHLHETRRLEENLRAVTATTDRYRRRLDSESASCEVLRLRCREFERLRGEDARRLREQGIRIRRLEAAATHATATRLEAAAPLRDTVRILVRDTLILHDTVRLFRWHDTWVTVEGELRADSVRCRVESVDTLRQVVRRIPRRFLFIRWGTKALRQEITSSNPHTRIVSSEYLRIE